MSDVMVGLTPSQWGDVLQGLKLLIGQPGISGSRKTEIAALGRNVRRQVDECSVAGDPTDAKRRDYDHKRVECATCENVGMVPVEQDGVERWAVCDTCQGKRVSA